MNDKCDKCEKSQIIDRDGKCKEFCPKGSTEKEKEDLFMRWWFGFSEPKMWRKGWWNRSRRKLVQKNLTKKGFKVQKRIDRKRKMCWRLEGCENWQKNKFHKGERKMNIQQGSCYE